MGLDLTLLPFDGDDERWGFSHTMLYCQRRSDLFEELLKLRTDSIPEEFRTYLCRDDSYEESHYGNTQETPYGEALGYVLVRVLLPFADHVGVQDNSRNRAIWAFLAQCEPADKIALYWH